jgi:parallel beta-helix repeat protein
MKSRILVTLAAGASGLILASKSAFAQGSLTPPPSAVNAGVPIPTMLTLTQVEPRTPVDYVHTPTGGSGIGAAEYLITQPGSYYLTSNVVAVANSNGISIYANDVTLDLRGFAVMGSSSGFNGIYIPAGYTNITVHNGTISGWTSASGLSYGNGVESYGGAVTMEHLNVSSNYQNGIWLINDLCAVRDCNVTQNGDSGITVANNSLVTGCIANLNCLTFNGYGIDAGANCMVTDCTVDNTGWYGIYVGNNCIVKDCTVTTNSNNGISVFGSGSTVVGCTANGNFGTYGAGILCQSTNCVIKGNTADNNYNTGISADGGSVVTGNTANGNLNYGISVGGGQNLIDSNYTGQNGQYGISVENMNYTNVITRNFAPGNKTGGYYNYPGNNDYAPIGTPATATSPWQNF